MKNVAFQNSLRNKDSERFTASLREGGTVIPQAANGMTTENTVKENEPNYDAIETKIPIDTELRDNTKFNEYVNFNNASLKGSYKVENKLKPESISAIENFTKDNENVSYPDVYSILYAESSGGQFFHEAAKGPLQIQLGAFVDSQVYQKKYKPVPEKGTPEHDVYMAEAAKDYDKLDELGQVNASLNYLEYLNKRFERNNKRKPTIIESATMYNQGYGGAKPYIADPSTYANNKLLNTYINNVSGVNKAITIPGRNQGGITTEPWGGANGSLYGAPTNREPAAPLNVQEQTKQVFNSTPKLSGGGGLEKITAYGTRDTGFSGGFGGSFGNRGGISSGRPTDTLTNTFADSLVAAEKHDKTYKYADTKNEEASSEEQSEEQSEEDFKNVATEANFTNRPYTKEERDIQNYKGEQPVTYDEYTEEVSIKEGVKNFIDNIVETYSKPRKSVENIETEVKKIADNIIEKIAINIPGAQETIASINGTLRPLGTDYSSTASGNILRKYGTTDKFIAALKGNPVSTLTDVGLLITATAIGTKLGGPFSTIALSPLYNKYSTPRLNEGGTPTQGIDEIVVTGKRDDSPSYDYGFSSGFGGRATGRQVKDSMASSRDIGDQLFQSDPEFFAKLSYAQKADKEDGTNDNVLKWQQEMTERNKNRYTEEEETSEAKLGGGKNVFGQYKGNKTNKKSTAEQNLTKLDADYLRYTDAVESNEPKKVSIKEGFKNFVDNVADTYSKPLDTVKDVETEAKKLVDNSVEKLALLFPETEAVVTSVNDTLRPFGTDYSSTATGKLLTKYTTPDRFVSALKADPVGTLTDIGLVVGATVLGTRFGAPASTVALGPLYNKYSK